MILFVMHHSVLQIHSPCFNIQKMGPKPRIHNVKHSAVEHPHLCIASDIMVNHPHQKIMQLSNLLTNRNFPKFVFIPTTLNSKCEFPPDIKYALTIPETLLQRDHLIIKSLNRIRRSSQINDMGPGDDDDKLELLIELELLTDELDNELDDDTEELESDELLETDDDEIELEDDTDDDEIDEDEETELDDTDDELETLDELIDDDDERDDTLDGDDDELTSSTAPCTTTIFGYRRGYGIRANVRKYDWPKR